GQSAFPLPPLGRRTRSLAPATGHERADRPRRGPRDDVPAFPLGASRRPTFRPDAIPGRQPAAEEPRRPRPVGAALRALPLGHAARRRARLERRVGAPGAGGPAARGPLAPGARWRQWRLGPGPPAGPGAEAP